MDHAIEDGKTQPLIIVLPTYNNTSESDSENYSLALRLTDNFHNELVNDLIPAVVPTPRAQTGQGWPPPGTPGASAGSPLGSTNTWRTFQHALDCFRYFAPSSGGPIGDGEFMADIVRNSEYGPGAFGLNDPVSREQLSVILARFQGGDAAWTGDPALAAAATRAQVAHALEQAKITKTQNLVVAKQGMFSSGGTVTEPVEGDYDSTTNWLELERHGNTAHVGHANVFYQIPQNDTGPPIPRSINPAIRRGTPTSASAA